MLGCLFGDVDDDEVGQSTMTVFVPMVFNFDKPETKDFTETVRLRNRSRTTIRPSVAPNISTQPSTRTTQSMPIL